jgi:DNA packaging protein, QLRG family|nr:MAG TPA: head tail connector [Caudoviricetes sp.]
MKVSKLTIEIVANYIRVEVTTASKTILDMVIPAAVEYCATYTGLSKEALDEYDDMAMAVMALCGEFYDNRTYTAVENAIINPTTQAILDKYSMNLMEGYQYVQKG